MPRTQNEVPKPSEGLEYTYARKPSNFDHEKKDLAHIWEVGGSHEFAEEIAQGDQLFLTVKQVRVGPRQGWLVWSCGWRARAGCGVELPPGRRPRHAAGSTHSMRARDGALQVTTAVVVVVVDLSDPSSVLGSLLGWLDHVKRKLGTTYEKFEKKGLQLPEQLRQRAKVGLARRGTNGW